VPRPYVPDAGDIVWLDFAPQAGREQSGHRPGLVLSPAAYNRKTSLMVCCPLTTQIKNYPFEVAIAGLPQSVVLADQVKSLDWRGRHATRKGRVSPAELADVRAKIHALIGG
jgi:mRNA interferase MazF